MSIFRKMRAVFHDDWCKECTATMDVVKKQLYMLPQSVGNYVSHTDAEYYKKNLMKIERKAEIPIGCYACGIYVYRCPECGSRMVKLSVFLPVRDEEKYEENIYFTNGEMDDFLID